MKGNSKGFGLLELLVLASIVGILGAAISSMFKYSFRAISSVSLKGDLAGLQRYVLDRLDCEATVKDAGGVLLPCDPATPFLLRDRTGNPITDANGRVGNWNVRAFCDNTRIFIQRARSTTDINEAVNFEPDPLSRQPATWQNLYAGSAGPTCASSYAPAPGACAGWFCDTCAAATAATKFCIASGPLGRVPPLNPVGPRTTGYATLIEYCGNKPPAVPEAALPSGNMMPDWGVHWEGTAVCPAGFVAISGGVHCQVAPHGGLILDSYPQMVGGNYTTWFAECCVADGERMVAGAPAITQSPAAGHVFVTCARE